MSHETLFSLELLIDHIRFDRVIHPAVAVRFLDFPTLLIHQPRTESASKSDDGVYLFHKGKSCVFKINVDSLRSHLRGTPLYVMLLDVTEEIPKLLGSSSVSLAKTTESLRSDGESLVSSLCNLMGHSIGSVAFSYRIVRLGENPHGESVTRDCDVMTHRANADLTFTQTEQCCDDPSLPPPLFYKSNTRDLQRFISERVRKFYLPRGVNLRDPEEGSVQDEEDGLHTQTSRSNKHEEKDSESDRLTEAFPLLNALLTELTRLHGLTPRPSGQTDLTLESLALACESRIQQKRPIDGARVEQRPSLDSARIEERLTLDSPRIHQQHPIDSSRIHQRHPIDSSRIHQRHPIDSSRIHQHPIDSSRIHQHPIDSSRIHQHPIDSSRIHHHPIDSPRIHQRHPIDSSCIHHYPIDSPRIHQRHPIDSSRIHQHPIDSSRIHQHPIDSSRIHQHPIDSSRIHQHPIDSSRIHQRHSLDSSQIHQHPKDSARIRQQRPTDSTRTPGGDPRLRNYNRSDKVLARKPSKQLLYGSTRTLRLRLEHVKSSLSRPCQEKPKVNPQQTMTLSPREVRSEEQESSEQPDVSPRTNAPAPNVQQDLTDNSEDYPDDFTSVDGTDEPCSSPELDRPKSPVPVQTTTISKPSLMETTTISKPSLMETTTISKPSLMETTTISKPSLMETTTISKPSLMGTTTHSKPSHMELMTQSKTSVMETTTPKPSLMETTTPKPSLMETMIHSKPSLTRTNTLGPSSASSSRSVSPQRRSAGRSESDDLSSYCSEGLATAERLELNCLHVSELPVRKLPGYTL